MKFSKYNSLNFDDFYTSFSDFNVELFAIMQQGLVNHNPINNILDIACGTGVSTRALGKIFNESNILGIDYNNELIKFANSAFIPNNIKYLVHDANQLNTLKKSFDLIIAKSSLHLINEEYLFNDYIQVLNSKGTFCLVEKTNTSIDSFPLIDGANNIWKEQCSQKRKDVSLKYYIHHEDYEVKTFKFGQEIVLDTIRYENGIRNKQISCLWDFSNQHIEDWINNTLTKVDLIKVFEEYDIIAITKK